MEECDHDNSVRCESPLPKVITCWDDAGKPSDVNWSGPWWRNQWVCQKCKQKSDHPPLFRECKSCAYKICQGCFYGSTFFFNLHDQQNARKAVQPPPIFASLNDEEGGSSASGRAERRSLFAAACAAAGTNTLQRQISESGEEVGGGSVLARAGSKLAMKRAARAADKAAADKAAADKAAAIVIDLSRASDTYVHHLGVRFDYL